MYYANNITISGEKQSEQNKIRAYHSDKNDMLIKIIKYPDWKHILRLFL